MKPVVRESNETIKVPVMYGNEERWKSVRGRGVVNVNMLKCFDV